MKHENEIDKLLKDLLYESWMSDQDYQEIINDTFKSIGITKKQLSEELEVGLKKGYTIEQQFDLLKQVLK